MGGLILYTPLHLELLMKTIKHLSIACFALSILLGATPSFAASADQVRLEKSERTTDGKRAGGGAKAEKSPDQAQEGKSKRTKDGAKSGERTKPGREKLSLAQKKSQKIQKRSKAVGEFSGKTRTRTRTRTRKSQANSSSNLSVKKRKTKNRSNK